MAEDLLLVRINSILRSFKMRGCGVGSESWVRGREERMEERMPKALQVPDPEGIMIHANAFGLYFKYTLKRFPCRQVLLSGWPLESSF